MKLGELVVSAAINGQVNIRLLNDLKSDIAETKFFDQSAALSLSDIADWKDCDIVEINSGMTTHKTAHSSVSIPYVSIDVKNPE